MHTISVATIPKPSVKTTSRQVPTSTIRKIVSQPKKTSPKKKILFKQLSSEDSSEGKAQLFSKHNIPVMKMDLFR